MIAVAFEFAHKRVGIEIERFSKTNQVPGIEQMLVLEQKIMHLPKSALSSSCFRGFSRRLGVRMYLRQRKMSKDKTKLLADYFLNFFENYVGCAAMRTLEVSIFHQRNRRTFRAFHMVAWSNGRNQFRPTVSRHLLPPFLATLQVRSEFRPRPD